MSRRKPMMDQVYDEARALVTCQPFGMNAGLDGMRALAAITVAISNVPIICTLVPFQGSKTEQEQKAISTMGMLGHSSCQVDLFFALSGYFLSTKVLRMSPSTSTYGHLISSRLQRTWPAIIVLNLIWIIFTGSWNTRLWIATLGYLFPSEDVFSTYPFAFIHQWSMAVDMIAYAVIPLLIWYLRSKNLLKLRVVALLLVFLACVRIGIVWMHSYDVFHAPNITLRELMTYEEQIFLKNVGVLSKDVQMNMTNSLPAPHWGQSSTINAVRDMKLGLYWNPVTRIFPFFVGLMVALAEIKVSSGTASPRKVVTKASHPPAFMRCLSWVSFLAMLLIPCVSSEYISKGLLSQLYTALFRPLYAVAAGLFIYSMGQLPASSRPLYIEFFEWRIWAPIARLSYSLYTLHLLFAELYFWKYATGWVHATHTVAHILHYDLGIYMAILLVGSAISYLCIEIPIQVLLSAFFAKMRSALAETFFPNE